MSEDAGFEAPDRPGARDATTPDPTLPPSLCRGGAASGTRALIDDFADGDLRLTEHDGRNGEWFLHHDTTGAFTEPENEALLVVELEIPAELSGSSETSFGLSLGGQGFRERGGGPGFNFHRANGKPCTYGVAPYQGIRFVARGRGIVRVEVFVPAVSPEALGGVCRSEGCGNFHGITVNLAPSFRAYSVRFDQLAQEPGFGLPGNFDREQILGVWFRVLPAQDFELQLGAVRFFPESPLASDGGLSEAGIPEAGPEPESADASSNEAGAADAGSAPEPPDAAPSPMDGSSPTDGGIGPSDAGSMRDGASVDAASADAN